MTPVTIEFPCRLVSANQLARGSWRSHAPMAKQQRTAAFAAMLRLGRPRRLEGAAAVRITRIAPRRFDDDNLARSCKAVRDGVADWLGVDDGDERITWLYGQEKGEPRQHAVRVEVFRDVEQCAHCDGLGVAL